MIKNKYLFSGIVLTFLVSISLAPTIDSQTLTPIPSTTNNYFASYPTLIGLEARINALENIVTTNTEDIAFEWWIEYVEEVIIEYTHVNPNSYNFEIRSGTFSIPELLDLGIVDLLDDIDDWLWHIDQDRYSDEQKARYRDSIVRIESEIDLFNELKDDLPSHLVPDYYIDPYP